MVQTPDAPEENYECNYRMKTAIVLPAVWLLIIVGNFYKALP